MFHNNPRVYPHPHIPHPVNPYLDQVGGKRADWCAGCRICFRKILRKLVATNPVSPFSFYFLPPSTFSLPCSISPLLRPSSILNSSGTLSPSVTPSLLTSSFPLLHLSLSLSPSSSFLTSSPPAAFPFYFLLHPPLSFVYISLHTSLYFIFPHFVPPPSLLLRPFLLHPRCSSSLSLLYPFLFHSPPCCMLYPTYLLHHVPNFPSPPLPHAPTQVIPPNGGFSSEPSRPRYPRGCSPGCPYFAPEYPISPPFSRDVQKVGHSVWGRISCVF